MEREAGGKKIGWEMRDCAQAKSRPAGPACCLRDCKLSLRMQTDMRDRHHLAVLPSNTESARPVRQCPSASLLLSAPHSSLSRSGAFMKPPHLFPLPPSRDFPSVTRSLFAYETSPRAAKCRRQGRRGCCHRAVVHWFIGSL